MYKVKNEDLVEVTNLLDALMKLDTKIVTDAKFIKLKVKIQKVSYNIKSNYTEKKPYYEEDKKLS